MLVWSGIGWRRHQWQGTLHQDAGEERRGSPMARMGHTRGKSRRSESPQRLRPLARMVE